jgi:hypothetical protein
MKIKPIKEYVAWYEFLQSGKVIKNAIQVKNIQMFVSGVAGILTATVTISQAMGMPIIMSTETVQQVAGGFGSLFLFANIIAVAISSDKVGLPTKK